MKKYILDSVGVEELHRPSLLWRRETAEEQHPTVRRQKRLQWMPLNDNSALTQVHFRTDASDSRSVRKLDSLRGETLVLDGRASEGKIASKGTVGGHDAVAGDDRASLCRSRRSGEDGPWIVSLPKWIDVQRITHSSGTSWAADNFGNLPVGRNPALGYPSHGIVNFFCECHRRKDSKSWTDASQVAWCQTPIAYAPRERRADRRVHREDSRLWH